MLPSVIPFAVPSLALASIVPHQDGGPVPMLPTAFAPSPIRCMSASALFYAFECSSVDASGAVGASRFWNHSAGTWDATFDPAAHVAPMTPCGPSGSANASFQKFSVPYPVASQGGASALFYTRAAGGALTPWGVNAGLQHESGAD